MLIRRDSCAGETKLQSNQVCCLTEHKGGMAACSWAYPKSFTAPEVQWEAGTPPGEEDVGVRGPALPAPQYLPE